MKTLKPQKGRAREKETKMKHSIWLCLSVLCLATSLFAQEPNDDQQKQKTGTICNSACVQPVQDRPTCDITCTDKSGDVVLVDDQGDVMKIANPKMAMPHMKKHVKVVVIPTEKEREQYLRIMELTETGG
jgi:hypothetical protein